MNKIAAIYFESFFLVNIKLSTSYISQVVQEEEVADIIKLFHDHTAHPGINTTIRKIRVKYYWVRLSKDVREYVRSFIISGISFLAQKLRIFISRN